MFIYWENFKEFKVQQTLHILIGMLAGFCVTTAPTLFLEVPWGACVAAAFIIISTVWKRQDLEFQKRDDTPGIDLAFYMAGLLAGVGFGVLAWVVG